MTATNNNLKRLWLDFRYGHSIYLNFILGIVNFLLISYNFAISRIPIFQGLDTVTFAILFAGCYIPAAIVIGYLHRKKQYAIENEAWLEQNWPWAWLSLYQIRLIEGKATDEETKKIKEYLEQILRNHKKI